MYALQKKAKAVKKELEAIHIEAEVDGVVVIMTAEMNLIDIKIPDEMMGQGNNERLAKAIVQATEKAKKKAEQVSAEKMKGVLGSMGLGGMPGMQ